MNTTVDAERGLMRQEELGRYNHHGHPYEDPSAKAGQNRPYSNRSEGRVLRVDAVFEHELVEGVHQGKGHVGPDVLGQSSIREELS